VRVAFVHPAYPESEGTGAVHTATLLVRGLVDRDHDVTVLCRRGPAPDDSTALAARVESLDASGFPYHTATATNRALERRARGGAFDGYDVVHSYLPTTVRGMAAVGRDGRTGTVVSLNGYDGVCPKSDLRYMDDEQCRDRGPLRCAGCSIATSPGHETRGAAYRSASRLGRLRVIGAGLDRLDGIDAFLPISDHVGAIYADFGFPEPRLSTVPTPVDERFLTEHRSGFDPPFRLLYVGYLERHKGVDRLLPVLKQVRDAGVDARLTVVGRGGARGGLERQARETGLDDVTRFTGYVPNAELPPLYADHDLFVYPGRWQEPRGRVFLEALATGTPVVATDVGAAEQLVGDAGTVTPQSVDALADAVVDLLEDGPLDRMSAAGHERVRRYRLGAVIRRLEDVYERVAEPPVDGSDRGR
jgi:glycosyltransferase involved in cell wall biosynthesis